MSDLDAQSSPEVLKYLQQDPAPVAPVAELAEVAERLLWTAHHLLHLAELVTERDEQLAVTLPLVRGQGQDAGNVVTVRL